MSWDFSKVVGICTSPSRWVEVNRYKLLEHYNEVGWVQWNKRLTCPLVKIIPVCYGCGSGGNCFVSS